LSNKIKGVDKSRSYQAPREEKNRQQRVLRALRICPVKAPSGSKRFLDEILPTLNAPLMSNRLAKIAKQPIANHAGREDQDVGSRGLGPSQPENNPSGGRNHAAGKDPPQQDAGQSSLWHLFFRGPFRPGDLSARPARQAPRLIGHH
jgi:hypothetical protein